MDSSSTSTSEILKKLKIDCATPPERLRNVADSMTAQMRAGLAPVDDGRSDLKMLLSYVNSLPTGLEEGLFYALDLGGTNFRVLRVQLKGGGKFRIQKTSEKKIPDDWRTASTKEELFGYMASVLSKFVKEEEDEHKIPRETERKIGFTFSFPVNQTSIKKGTLIEWTKEFNVPNAVGEDVVSCLEEAMKKEGLDMFSVTALVNDTVGTLAGARYKDRDVKVAVILGTGTNACYIERVEAIPERKGEGDKGPITKYGHTIINTEWGAFSDKEVLPITKYDDLGNGSTDQAKRIFEKMISGKYLGAIVTKIVLEMAGSEEWFRTEDYSSDHVLSTRDINEMQSDNSDQLEIVGSKLEERLKVETTLDVRRTVVMVIDTIVKRAARLAGAGIVAILQKMEQDTKGLIIGKRTVVAIDGTLYQKYEQYRLYLEEAVNKLVPELLGSENSENVKIKQFPDASGVGAALLAYY